MSDTTHQAPSSGQPGQQPTEVYRDGQWLVVPLDTTSLPGRCLRTNEPANGNMKEYTIVDPKAGYEFGPTFGFRMKINRHKVRLPVSEDWTGDLEIKKALISRRMLSLSIPALIAGWTVAIALAVTVPKIDSTLEWTILFGSVGLASLGICGTIVGFCIPYLDGIPGADDSIRVGLITDTHFWLAEPHEDYLSTVPTWSGPSREAYLAERPSFLSAACRAWPTMVTWLVIIAAVAFTRVIIRRFL